MGQSITLYRIDKSDFPKVTDNANEFGLFEMSKECLTFEKSFEGLRFVLSKGFEEETKQLIDKIFYPKTFVGEEIDFSTVDFENIPTDYDFFKMPTYYNDSLTVNKISRLLETINEDDFKKRFNHEELNIEGIYPSGVWNTETGDNYAFNEKSILIEFIMLKKFFKDADKDEDYILSYLG